ncbi:MAG: sulfatase-like hydrolase/transferase [Planctomycetota bacterium]|jgi:choline-sulfatase
MTNTPDILFIFSDQHALRVSGPYGDTVAKTPALDRLAHEGMTFDNCYTPSPICMPARMAMLTGRNPHDTEVWTNNDILPTRYPTYAHSLSAAGYDTISVGRLHVLGSDQNRGFGTRLVGDHSPNWPGVSRHDMGVLRRTHGPNRISVERSGCGNSAYQSIDEATLDASLSQLGAIAEKRKAGDQQPFFMQVGFMLPHPPYVANEEDLEIFRDGVPPPRLGPDADPHPWIKWWRNNRGIENVTDEEAARSREAYYALVLKMDRQIGALLARLDELGFAENTMVVYSSDHGDHIGERGLWWKHTMYDDSAKVPLIVRWPQKVAPNSRCAEVMSLLDVSASFLDVARAAPLANSTGHSLVGLLTGQEADWTGEAFSEYCVDPGEPYSGGEWTLQRMLRTGRWKYIYHEGAPDQLFDLQSDPDELHDLIGVVDYHDVASELQRRVLEDWNPATIRTRMTKNAKDKVILRSWAEAVRPEDVLRWEFDPDINWVEGY